MLKNIGLGAVTVSMALSGAMPAFAQTTTKVKANLKTEAKLRAEKKAAERAVNVSCIQAAVEKRDTALVSAVGTFSTSIQSALTTRRDALKAAWAQTDRTARKNALQTAWNSYKKSTRSSKEILKSSRKSAWDTYKTEAKSCNATEDGTGSGIDNFGV